MIVHDLASDDRQLGNFLDGESDGRVAPAISVIHIEERVEFVWALRVTDQIDIGVPFDEDTWFQEFAVRRRHTMILYV